MVNTEDLCNVHDIAIIGMAGRFPGASTINQFWENIKNGVESITFFSDTELPASEPVSDNNYVKAKPLLQDIELFDASFFGFTPSEAMVLDPQIRLFLECAWESLENAGYNTWNYKGQIACFAGASMSTYLLNCLSPHKDIINSHGPFQVRLKNEKDHLPLFTAYKLNLKGPCISVQTACSTSLVATHLAAQSLLNGECDLALAGGVHIQVPQNEGYMYMNGGILSPDGHCRAFDKNAKGTLFGNGVGVIVLKRKSEALHDGDYIHAVIKGSAVNNDGALRVGYTAPGVEGQLRVISEAIDMADINPESISFIETHGTATELGDPIEIQALSRAFRAYTDKKQYCAIGSVKTNIGHLSVAGGMAGMVKTIMSLKHKQIPPSLHYTLSNPNINFPDTPFFVNTQLKKWDSGNTPRRAGISSFGMGGTNSHIILEESPPDRQSGKSRAYHLITLSARSETALNEMTNNLVDYLEKEGDINTADAAYTLHIGRRRFAHKRFTVVNSMNELISTLKNMNPKRVITGYEKKDNKPIVFMFPGVGDLYPHMGWELYNHEDYYKTCVNDCLTLVKTSTGIDCKEILFPGIPEKKTKSPVEHPGSATSAPSYDLHKIMTGTGGNDDLDELTKKLNKPSFAYPSLFIIEYAMATLLMKWGIIPRGMIGHSFGEYVAACLAGVFSLKDALYIVTKRGQLVEQCDKGLMLSVMLPEKEVKPYLCKGVSIAGIDESSVLVLSGETPAITGIEERLLENAIACRRVRTTHAFHSHMMDPILKPLTDIITSVKRHPPTIPFISNLTGTWITPEQAVDPGYWALQMRHTVRFFDGVKTISKEQEGIFLEIGPGRSLSTLINRYPHIHESQYRIISTMRRSFDPDHDLSYLLTALGKLWLAGIIIDWPVFYENERRHRIPLPTYPFERKRYWIDGGDDHNNGIKNKGDLPSSTHQGLYERPLLDITYTAPRTETEIKLARLWQQALGIKEIGIHDGFLELGGNSLLAIQILFSIRKAFTIDILMADLVKYSTISLLADYIDTLSWIKKENHMPEKNRHKGFVKKEGWQEIEL